MLTECRSALRPAILGMLFAVVIGGCMTAPDPVTVTPGAVAEPPPGEDQDLAAERLAAEMAGRSKLAQYNRAFADNYCRLAAAALDRMEVETAKEHLKLALRYDPEHAAARALLEKVQGLLGERPDKIRTYYEWAVQEQEVRLEQRRVSIRSLIERGREAYDRGDYQAAADRLEQALRLITWMPYHLNMTREHDSAQAMLEQAKKKMSPK